MNCGLEADHAGFGLGGVSAAIAMWMEDGDLPLPLTFFEAVIVKPGFCWKLGIA